LFGSTPRTWRGFWSRRPTAPAADAGDAAIILDHVRGIFGAYLARDREAIRRAHTDDWTGFLVGSAAIERGIAAYMRGADHSLATFRGTAFEITDHALEVRGELALLYYTARYDYKDADDRPATLRLRSLDVYRREPGGGWNQAGSHIAIVPPGG
jgi:ketosteroid isomerase-like protein